MPSSIILFDGVCNFCNASINFIIDRDKKQIFTFAALQSEAGQQLLKRYRLPENFLDTIILLENDRFFTASTAILRIARKLPFPWPLLCAFIIIPPFFRDPVYNFIAKNRYKWFGKSEQCRVPAPELRERFLMKSEDQDNSH
jgi:predicted DCC family thiol-disulfide oxidoreductase YuxK